MISLELAKKLKEAGLEWEPKQGDFYWFVTPDESQTGFVQSNRGAEGFKAHVDRCRGIVCTYVFAPRLDQLLAEIEKRGFIWALDVSATNGNKVIGYAMNIATSLDWEDEEEFRSDSPEEAAASALLWILEGGTSK